MYSSGETKLPFGNFPRLILAWVCTEAVRTQNRVIVLGPSLAKFMKTLGVYSSGGGRDQIKLRNQMRRLFGCTVQLTYKDANVERFVNSPIAARGEYWWNLQQPDQPSLWDSKIELGWDFFNEIIRHPMPLDMNTSRPSNAAPWASISTYGSPTAPSPFAPRNGSLGVNCTASSKQTPPKPATRETIKFFRRKVLRELKKIKLAWPGLNYTTPQAS